MIDNAITIGLLFGFISPVYAIFSQMTVYMSMIMLCFIYIFVTILVLLLLNFNFHCIICHDHVEFFYVC
jgi:hypothetical protein